MDLNDYLEGLGGTGAELDPDKVAGAEQLDQMADTLVARGDDMAIVGLAPSLRAQLGVTGQADAAVLLDACSAFAQEAPEICQQTGDTPAQWQVVVDADLAYSDAQAALAPVVQSAVVVEAVVLHGLS